ncbi:C3 and PZP-like alpha-2-macroglobulin domain-containing protein 8 [Mytilus edulis]|uniref:C3 and PZP-like alpha-2-macroglobulin domain-containing protein 8 n=1 Tax=Mytilus edulis TaxID=6550 RepID=UPI0039EDEA14
MKHVTVTTPPLYQSISLSDYYIDYPHDETLTFEVKVWADAIIVLVPDEGFSSLFYEVVIGGAGNTRCFIRKRTLDRLNTKVNILEDNQLNAGEYRAFWVRWKGGHIEVGRGLTVSSLSSKYIEWVDPNPLDISAVYVKSIDVAEFTIYQKTENPRKYSANTDHRAITSFTVTLFVRSRLECSITCHRDVSCIHFNYKRSTRLCELMQASKTDVVIKDSEYNFYF